MAFDILLFFLLFVFLVCVSIHVILSEVMKVTVIFTGEKEEVFNHSRLRESHGPPVAAG